MQWASKVGRREKGEEGSAWLARLSAPRTATLPCDPYMFFSLSPACAASAALNGSTMRLVERREEGEEGSAWLARLGAPRTATLPCVPYMFFSLSPACAASAALNGSTMRLVERREEGEEGSAWLARLGAPRTATLPCDPYMFFSLSPACAASLCRAQRTPTA